MIHKWLHLMLHRMRHRRIRCTILLQWRNYSTWIGFRHPELQLQSEMLSTPLFRCVHSSRCGYWSPHKWGKVDIPGLFDNSSPGPEQLPWHKTTIKAFKGCASEISCPLGQRAIYVLCGRVFIWERWGLTFQIRAHCFKSEGQRLLFTLWGWMLTWQTCPNNLSKRKIFSLSEKDTKLCEMVSMEITE